MIREILEELNESMKWKKGKSYDGTPIVTTSLKVKGTEYGIEIGKDDNDKLFAVTYGEELPGKSKKWDDYGSGQFQLSFKWFKDMEVELEKTFKGYKSDYPLFTEVMGELDY